MGLIKPTLIGSEIFTDGPPNCWFIELSKGDEVYAVDDDGGAVHVILLLLSRPNVA